MTTYSEMFAVMGVGLVLDIIGFYLIFGGFSKAVEGKWWFSSVWRIYLGGWIAAAGTFLLLSPISFHP